MTGTRFKDAGMYIQSEIVAKRVRNTQLELTSPKVSISHRFPM